MLKFDWFYMKFDWFVGLSYLHNKCMSSFMNVYLVLWLGFQVWTDELFKLATNILSQNASRNVFLLKAWVLCVCACVCVCVCVRMCVRMRVRLTLKRLFEAKWHVSVAQIQKKCPSTSLIFILLRCLWLIILITDFENVTSPNARGGKSTKIFYSSKSTITLLKFYLSTSKSTSLKIYSSKSKK